MTQEYIETMVLDDPLGEAKKPLIGEAAHIVHGQDRELVAKEDDTDIPADPGHYSWLS